MYLSMGIIKVEVSLPEATQAIDAFRKNRIKAFETMTSEIRSAVESTISHLLQAEMTFF